MKTGQQITIHKFICNAIQDYSVRIFRIDLEAIFINLQFFACIFGNF